MEARSQAGLFVTSGMEEAVTLTNVRVRVRVRGGVSRVTVTQDYENREQVPVEAVYIFPLEEGSAVSGFSVTVGDRVIRGRALPRDEAFDRYDDAMAEGHGAYLLDQERPNIFTASVGNLMPGQRARVEISYVAELATEGDGVRLLIPTTVSPRYVPESRRDFEGMTDAERVSPPLTLEDTPYRLDLEVEADLLSAIREVESPSHKIRTELRDGLARIRLAGDEGALDRDFILLLRAEEPHRPSARQAKDAEGDRFVMVSFQPEFELERSPAEIVFLVDCSGSMDGGSMKEARRALLLCLQSLREGDRYNIVRFGSTHESLFPASISYDDESLMRGREYSKRMDADLGGTEILEPLTQVLEQPEIDGIPRRVVLLTDGQVSNEDDVIELARRHRRRTLIFGFGIGAGVSEHLVRGVSRASGGAAEFVHPGERIEKKVLRHFARIAAGGLELELEWGGLGVEDVTPAEPPALAPGERVDFVARLTSGTDGVVRLRGRKPGAEFEVEAPVREGPPDAEADRLVPLIWARRRIRELETGDAGLRGSRQRGRGAERLDTELVRLGTRYGLMNSAVSFVAIEEREEADRSTGRAKLRRIPVSLTKGWGEGGRSFTQVGGPMYASLSCSPPPPSPAPGRRFAPRARNLLKRETERPEQNLMSCCAPMEMSRSARRAEDEPPNVYFDQNADGSWNLTRAIANACGVDFDLLEKAATDSGHPEGERLLATLVVLALIERGPESERAVMSAMVGKAKDWVRDAVQHHAVPEGHESWEAWAAQIL